MAEAKIMFIAGEVSGDARCASLITALKQLCKERSLPLPRCFGAGGSNMTAAGVDLAVDMTRHAVIGHVDAIRSYFHFKRLFDQLLALACERKPEIVVLVDFSGFNLRFARAIKRRATAAWQPRVIYFISPQLWASRPGRARQMEQDVDLLLSIIPFEKSWYAKHAPMLRVEFVGHPLVDDYNGTMPATRNERTGPMVVLLPGSRKKEIAAHLPVMLSALANIRQTTAVNARLHLPDSGLVDFAMSLLPPGENLDVKMGSLQESLADASLAITKSGTVSLECALMRVPAVVIYITSPLLFYIGRRVINVPYLAMPNLLAGKAVYPELIQDAASPEAISKAALDLLHDQKRRDATCADLDHLRTLLGSSGASRRAAMSLLQEAYPSTTNSRVN